MPKATNDATDARAATPAVPGNDAELIQLCDRLIALEAKYDDISLTVEDEDEAERQSGLLTPEYNEIRNRLYAIAKAPVSDAWQARLCSGRHCECTKIF